MKILLIFLAVSTLAYEQIDGVLQLNRKDFDKAKEEFPYLVVKFYQEGCPYCQQIKPVYIELAKRLSDYGYTVAEVNVDENKVLSAKQGIKAYPTIKLYSKGRVIECPNSAEQSEFIFEYILQNTYDTQTQLDGAEDIYYFLKRNNIAILTYVDHDIADIPNKFPRIKFGLLPVQSQTSDTEKRTIHIYNKKFAEKKTYKGPVKDLADFINQNAFPRVFSFTEEEFEKAQTDQTKIIALVTEDKKLAERFSQVSEEFSNNFRFVVINSKEALPPQRFQHLARFPLKDKFLYAYDYQEFKVRQLPLKSDDVEDIKALITTLTGEETKEEIEITKKALYFQNDGQVHEFTQQNWDVQVNQNDNHVFVYFYAPWCGHCKSLAPIIQELATNIQATQPDVIVGKIDATQHKIEGFNVEGYPTIYLIRKVDGKVENIKYEGSRTLNAMANWLEKELPALPGQVIETVIFGPSNVTEVQSFNFDEIVWNTDKHVFIWFYDPNNKQCINLQEPMERLYHTFVHDPKILIARTDLTRNTFDLLKPTYVPSFFFITTENGERVFKRFETAKLYRTFKQYIEDNTGIQGVTIRGQYSNQGRVYTADIDNFDDLVLDSPQDVIVKFYAPWCQHCQNMADAYIDLAHNVRENPNILVVEMDWTEQKTSKVEVKGFPTIILFKKDRNPVGEQSVRQIVYQGPREAKFMEDFIKDNQPVYNTDL